MPERPLDMPPTEHAESRAGDAKDAEAASHVSLHASPDAKLVLVAVTVVILVAWSAVLLTHAYERHPMVSALVLGAGPAWLFVWWFGLYLLHRSRRRRSSHLPCVRCGYQLACADVHPAGRCPECGEAYERDQLEAYWRQFDEERPAAATAADEGGG